MPHIVVTIISFIVLLAIMVFVHEFGHFVVAKFFKVRVEAFSIGMGPRLFGYKYGETDYRVCAFPLGGYVMMTGENMPGENLGAESDKEKAKEEAAVDATPDPGALTSKPRWQRMLIGVAGPFANFVFAFVLMLFYLWLVNEVPAYFKQPVTIDYVPANTETQRAGLQHGDYIQSFAGISNPHYDQIADWIETTTQKSVPIVFVRDGKQINTTLALPDFTQKGAVDKLGFLPPLTTDLIKVDQISPDDPASKAGLQKGDIIRSADDQVFHSVSALLAYLQIQAGKPLNLVIERNGQTMQITAHPAPIADPIIGTKWRLGFSGVSGATVTDPMDFQKSLAGAANVTVRGSTLILQVLGKILTHQMSAKNLSGPIGMAQMAGDAAETKGWGDKVNLGAMISINLGILNLLPIPILDGGMIFILIIESIRRKDLSMNLKERIYQVAFVFLMVLMAFIIFNDISKFSIFHH